MCKSISFSTLAIHSLAIHSLDISNRFHEHFGFRTGCSLWTLDSAIDPVKLSNQECLPYRSEQTTLYT